MSCFVYSHSLTRLQKSLLRTNANYVDGVQVLKPLATNCEAMIAQVGRPVSHCVADTIGSRIEVEYYKIVGQSSILHSSIHCCEHGKKRYW